VPTTGAKRKTSGCCISTSEPITARAWVEHIGYVPGQILLFYAEVETKSRRMVSGTTVQLIQYSIFEAQGEKQICSRVLHQQNRGKFEFRESWSRVPIQIPAVVPTSLPFCKIITVGYRIVVSISKNSRFHCPFQWLLLI
jgi:Arrestin (or S-antigen), C-terminal domain